MRCELLLLFDDSVLFKKKEFETITQTIEMIESSILQTNVAAITSFVPDVNENIENNPQVN
jgi:hypothetical protein